MENIITLNVGGKQFQTDKAILMKSPYIANLLEGTELFIDRSPSVFKHVLEYLRDSSYLYPIKYQKELEFYLGTHVDFHIELQERIDGLTAKLEVMSDRMSDLEQQLSSAAQYKKFNNNYDHVPNLIPIGITHNYDHVPNLEPIGITRNCDALPINLPSAADK